MTPWQTNVLEVDCSVDIPTGGWYGLFLRLESDREPLLRIQHSKEVVEHRLPFLQEGKKLLDLDVGRNLYLPKGCVVSVVNEDDKKGVSDDGKNDSSPLPNQVCAAAFEPTTTSTTKTSSTNSNTACQWKLICYRMTERSAHPQPTLGKLATKKSLMCGQCPRIFASLQGLRGHRMSTHNQSGSPTDDPMWTTPLKVLYDDQYVVVIDKPQGMAVSGEKQTLFRSDLLLPLANTRQSKTSSSSDRSRDDDDKSYTKPRHVHRLDAGTGGCLVLAKTSHAERKLKQSFAANECHKVYRAIVVGALKDHGVIDEPISGKEAKTHYKSLSIHKSKSYGSLTVVELRPVTGRQHQIRRHLKHLGHPIIGDARHGFAKKETINYRLCLWATEIRLPHPITGKEILCQVEPSYMDYIVEQEKE